jgi:AraC-like DNA-binding protein
VERLVLVDEIGRFQTGRFQSQSLPGHLLHIVTAGVVRQWAEGRAEVVRPGTIVWYHENEPVRGEIQRAPWRFITINFHAPAVPPPPDDQRVLRAGRATLALGRKLLRLWRDRSLPPLEHQLQCHRALIELLQDVLPRAGYKPPAQPNAKVWWRIEKQLRIRLEQPISLDDIQRLGGLSLRTIIRACKAATGVPPMRRLKDIRLSFARGLVQHSDLTITEIAFRVGYARSQEFSRDYHRRFGITPREDRARPPGYRELERPPLASESER